MATRVGMYHFHCVDPMALATFWSAVLDIPIDDGATDEVAFIEASHQYGNLTWISSAHRTSVRRPTALCSIWAAAPIGVWRRTASRGSAPNGEASTTSKVTVGSTWLASRR